MDERPLQKHSKPSKTFIMQALESLGAFKMYYRIGASVPSLHRESTNSLIASLNYMYVCIILVQKSLFSVDCTVCHVVNNRLLYIVASIPIPFYNCTLLNAPI